jgi:ubiquinone/menaquinone biosynthesis C-methylase UbiE
VDYYSDRLSADRLRQCYDLAPPRVQQYFQAEIQHVLDRIRPTDIVLELGCGYGRVVDRLATRARTVVGIDTSRASLELAHESLHDHPNCRLLPMDAAALAFQDAVFDVTVCIQNGISAFKVDQHQLLAESLRVTRPGGRVLVSSYSAKFWPHRLEWFQFQAAAGLIGEIDPVGTRDGVIVCKDGFRATTIGPDQFRTLTAAIGVRCQIEEVDESSIFCEIIA